MSHSGRDREPNQTTDPVGFTDVVTGQVEIRMANNTRNLTAAEPQGINSPKLILKMSVEEGSDFGIKLLLRKIVNFADEISEDHYAQANTSFLIGNRQPSPASRTITEALGAEAASDAVARRAQ